nr:hypothetical protein [Phenylobacterium sp.]
MERPTAVEHHRRRERRHHPFPASELPRGNHRDQHGGQRQRRADDEAAPEVGDARGIGLGVCGVFIGERHGLSARLWGLTLGRGEHLIAEPDDRRPHHVLEFGRVHLTIDVDRRAAGGDVDGGDVHTGQ